MKPNGRLPIPDAMQIVPQLAKLTKTAKECNIIVVNSKDCHEASDEEISDNPDFKTTFPMHCERGTPGADFIVETEPDGPQIIDYKDKEFKGLNGSRNIVILKNKFDVFAGNPHTEAILAAISPEIILVYGVATNVCVDAFVVGAAKRGFQVVVVADAVKELPQIPMAEIIQNWMQLGVKACICSPNPVLRYFVPNELYYLDKVLEESR